MKYVLFVILLTLLSFNGFTQEIVDTIVFGSSKVVLYSDKTWRYIEYQTTDEHVYEPDTIQLFTQNWNDKLFGYDKPDYTRTADTCVIDVLRCGSSYKFPHNGNLLSPFGLRTGNMHLGMDISVQPNDSIFAAFDGVVRVAGWNNSGYGNIVIIRHYNGLETLYAHLSEPKCTRNQKVKAGQLIALGGRSGRASGYHLHFEIRFKDNSFNPEYIFNFDTKKIVSDEVVLLPEYFEYLKNKPIPNSTYHIVKQGDTLWAISRKYKISVTKICSLNGIDENATLSIGQKLKLK